MPVFYGADSSSGCCFYLKHFPAPRAQYERSTDAYERLTSTPDAKGRNIEVIKVPCPPPLFRTYKEASGVHVRPRIASPCLYCACGSAFTS